MPSGNQSPQLEGEAAAGSPLESSLRKLYAKHMRVLRLQQKLTRADKHLPKLPPAAQPKYLDQ